MERKKGVKTPKQISLRKKLKLKWLPLILLIFLLLVSFYLSFFSLQLRNVNASLDSTSIQPSDDSYVNVDYPGNNYGSSSVLYAGVWGMDTWRTWLKFDLSSIPANIIILSASLNLKVSSVSAPSPPAEWPIVHVYVSSNDSWSESTITWNNQPSYGDLLDSKELKGIGWYSWSLNWTKISEFTSDKTISFCLNTTQVKAYASFYSTEYVVADRPYLSIYYVTHVMGEWTPYYTPTSHPINRNVEPYLYMNTSVYNIETNSPGFEILNNATYIWVPMQNFILGARTWQFTNETILLWWEGGYNSTVSPHEPLGASQQLYSVNDLGAAYWLDTDLIWVKDYSYKLVRHSNGSLHDKNLWKMTETIMALDNGYSWVQLIEVEFQSGISEYPNGSIAHTFAPMMGSQQNNNATFNATNNCFIIDSKNNPFRTYIGSNVSISNWAANSTYSDFYDVTVGLFGDYWVDGCFSNTNVDLGNGTFVGFQFNYTNAYSGQKLLFPIIHVYTNKEAQGLTLYNNIKNNVQTHLESAKDNFYDFMDTSSLFVSSNAKLNDFWYWILARQYSCMVKTGIGYLGLHSPWSYGIFFGTSTNYGFGSYVENLLANNQFEMVTEILNAYLQRQFDNGHIPHDLAVNNSVNNIVYALGATELPDGLACYISSLARSFLGFAPTDAWSFISANWTKICKAVDKLYQGLQQPENLINETGGGQFWDTLIGRNGFTLWTNAYVYDAFNMASLMAKKNGNTTCYNWWSANATNVYNGIQTYLWNGTLGYYNSFYNGTYFGGEYDASGNMLAIIFNIANDAQKTSILSKAGQVGALQAFPIRTITPSYPASMDSQNWQYRENGGIFPMVSGWWIHNQFQGNNAIDALNTLEQIYQRTLLNLTGGYVIGSLEHYNQTTGEPTSLSQAYDCLWNEVPMTQAILQGMIGVTIGENIVLKPFVPSEITSLTLSNLVVRGTPLTIMFEEGGFELDSDNSSPLWDFYVDDESIINSTSSFNISAYLDGNSHEIKVLPNPHLPSWSMIDSYFMLGVGLTGIIMLIAGPTMFARTFIKHGLDSDSIEWLGYGMLFVVLGFGFVVVWLWPG